MRVMEMEMLHEDSKHDKVLLPQHLLVYHYYILRIYTFGSDPSNRYWLLYRKLLHSKIAIISLSYIFTCKVERHAHIQRQKQMQTFCCDIFCSPAATCGSSVHPIWPEKVLIRSVHIYFITHNCKTGVYISPSKDVCLRFSNKHEGGHTDISQWEILGSVRCFALSLSISEMGIWESVRYFALSFSLSLCHPTPPRLVCAVSLSVCSQIQGKHLQLCTCILSGCDAELKTHKLSPGPRSFHSPSGDRLMYDES